MKKRNFITGLLGVVLAVYSFTAYSTLHSLRIFFVSRTLGLIYAYTYLICGVLAVVLILSFVLSVVKAVKKRKTPQQEENLQSETETVPQSQPVRAEKTAVQEAEPVIEPLADANLKAELILETELPEETRPQDAVTDEYMTEID
ncbi:MAG: hypothetical protein IJ410_08025 [Oscillospiraceae bacterium]|nr:hypothetical protein [Oscillospiraceae bacterium]